MISKKAKERGRVNDLSAKIWAEAQARVNRAAVNGEVNAAKAAAER